ncbi:MAG TPA: hypothetical protein VNH11_11105 [Pirellulales bacterium]|nr:hypothetical protein [Pirellulales bacterium]
MNRKWQVQDPDTFVGLPKSRQSGPFGRRPACSLGDGLTRYAESCERPQAHRRRRTVRTE